MPPHVHFLIDSRLTHSIEKRSKLTSFCLANMLVCYPKLTHYQAKVLVQNRATDGGERKLQMVVAHSTWHEIPV